MFTNCETEETDKTTISQWKCQKQYQEKVGFILASKCKEVVTRQKALDKSTDKPVNRLAKLITICHYDENLSMRPLNKKPHNSRDWGLMNESCARESYLCT